MKKLARWILLDVFVLYPILTAYAYFYRPELFPLMFLTMVALVGLRTIRRNETVSLLAFVVLVIGIWVLYPGVRWLYPLITIALVTTAFILAPLMMIALVILILYIPVAAFKKLKSIVIKSKQ